MEYKIHEVFAGDKQGRPAGRKGVVRRRPGAIDRVMDRLTAPWFCWVSNHRLFTLP